jgi:hypothetical protein
MLVDLSRSSCDKVRIQIAENASTPVRALSALLADPSPEVRLALTFNRALPSGLLKLLCHDPSVDVRYGMAENPLLPKSVLCVLENDTNPYVAARATSTLWKLHKEMRVPETMVLAHS